MNKSQRNHFTVGLMSDFFFSDVLKKRTLSTDKMGADLECTNEQEFYMEIMLQAYIYWF